MFPELLLVIKADLKSLFLLPWSGNLIFLSALPPLLDLLLPRDLIDTESESFSSFISSLMSLSSIVVSWGDSNNYLWLLSNNFFSLLTIVFNLKRLLSASLFTDLSASLSEYSSSKLSVKSLYSTFIMFILIFVPGNIPTSYRLLRQKNLPSLTK